MYFYDCSKYWF